MEVEIRIRTSDFLIKKAKLITGKASSVYITKKWIGKEVLCIPLFSPDDISVSEIDSKEYLISCYGFEILKKTVKPKGRTVVKTGYVLLPEEYLTDDILIVPLE